MIFCGYMWSRILAAIFAFFAFLGFLRMPSLDTAILALPALMVVAIFLEDAWEYLNPREYDPGPRCPQCDYDIRATPIRCPECGLILAQSSASVQPEGSSDRVKIVQFSPKTYPAP